MWKIHIFRAQVRLASLWAQIPKMLTKDSHQIAQSKKMKVINDFFGPDLLSELGKDRFDLVISRHVLEHVIDLHVFMSTIR